MDSRWILVTDIDGTLLGDDAALERFVDWSTGHRGEHRLVYATGRHWDSLAGLIGASILPLPDAAITAVGTEVRDGLGGLWPGWSERLVGFDASAVRQALRPLPWLAPQPDAAQTPFKASYDAPHLTEARLEAVHAALRRAGQDARIVYSAGLHLDVLPAAAGKGIAASFLVEAWDASPDSVMVFGDTANDLDLYQRGFRGTVVANALRELEGTVDADVYRSPLPYAAGVLDGIRFWAGLDTPAVDGPAVDRPAGYRTPTPIARPTA